MSRELTKMNLISIVQQLPKEDIEVIEVYIKMIENENKALRVELALYKDNEKFLNEKIDKVIYLIKEHNKNAGKLYYKYNNKYLLSEFKEDLLVILER